MSFGGVDEKKLAAEIAVHAEEMRQKTIAELLEGLRGLLDTHEIVLSAKPKVDRT